MLLASEAHLLVFGKERLSQLRVRHEAEDFDAGRTSHVDVPEDVRHPLDGGGLESKVPAGGKATQVHVPPLLAIEEILGLCRHHTGKHADACKHDASSTMTPEACKTNPDNAFLQITLHCRFH